MLRSIALSVVLLAVVPTLAQAASRVPPPAAPQNPNLAPDPTSNIHNDTWMTDAYAGPGPRGPNLQTQLGALPPSLCGSLTFDSHGRIVTICPSSVSPPVLRMLDPGTLQVLGELTLPDAPAPPNTPVFQNFAGGGYFFLDDEDRVWTATKTSHLWVLTAGAGTTFRRTADYDLTSVVAADDRVISALPDFRGRIWFVTKRTGTVGVLDPGSGRIGVLRLGETVDNSFAIGRRAVYVVSDRRMYRLSAGRDDRPRVDWKVTYRNSGIVKPSQVGAGSGTTPTIMAGGLVAITDNADPMNVVVYRTAKRLRRAQRRVVCEVPVFARGASATENALIGSGRTLIAENNYGYRDPFGPLAGTITETGFARVDVDRRHTGCRLTWTNTTERAPSVVPKLSTATGLVYTYVQEPDGMGGQHWSWVGLDSRTGATAFKQFAGTGLEANTNYAGIGLGPDGTAYLGTIGGIRALRDGT
jgi:hypothetical protein